MVASACSLCGEEGHQAANCPSSIGSDDQETSNGNSSSIISNVLLQDEPTCSKCMKPGHLARDCKNDKTSAGSATIKNSSDDNDQEADDDYDVGVATKLGQMSLANEENPITDDVIEDEVKDAGVSTSGDSRSPTGYSSRGGDNSSSVVCYRCNKTGHMSYDCTEPSYRQSNRGNPGSGFPNKTCFKCNSPNHLARDCDKPDDDARPSSYRNGVYNNSSAYSDRSVRCYRCNKFGHLARECEETEDRCYRCNKAGHIARDCLEPDTMTRRQRPFNAGGSNGGGRKCYACGMEGHISRECPGNSSGNSQSRSRTCYNCGGPGHIAAHCPQSQSAVW